MKSSESFLFTSSMLLIAIFVSIILVLCIYAILLHITFEAKKKTEPKIREIEEKIKANIKMNDFHISRLLSLKQVVFQEKYPLISKIINIHPSIDMTTKQKTDESLDSQNIGTFGDGLFLFQNDTWIVFNYEDCEGIQEGSKARVLIKGLVYVIVEPIKLD